MGERGKAVWFHLTKGLNNVRYLPGFSQSNPDHLPASIVSEEECSARWKRNSSGYRYAVAKCEESPRMKDRIERLFEETYERPINQTKSIGVAFARGTLAEKKGFAVNWVEFAHSRYRRGRNRNLTLQNFGEKHADMRKRGRERAYVFNPDLGTVVHDLIGADDDWELNVKHAARDTSSKYQKFDLLLDPRNPQSQVIEHPLYSRRLINEGNSRKRDQPVVDFVV
ncbi:hypothetical protein M758_UG178000 [Ceratodon purpureus]|nr:hypothetical protein M758_UG178000 [Ceratodon purpureus]KAG0595573.1 hypothetical protein M758_UG178000 [Ceratodon purpureus]